MASSASDLPDQSEYQLHLYNIHTRETLDLVYRRGDQYDAVALAKINEYLRDYRTGAIQDYDPRVFDLLHGGISPGIGFELRKVSSLVVPDFYFLSYGRERSSCQNRQN